MPNDDIEKHLADIGFEVLTPNRLQIRLNGSVVEINSNSQEFLNRLAQFYPATANLSSVPDLCLKVVEEESLSHTEILNEEFIELSSSRTLQKLSSGMVFLRGKKTNLVKGPALANVDQIVKFIDGLIDSAK